MGLFKFEHPELNIDTGIMHEAPPVQELAETPEVELAEPSQRTETANLLRNQTGYPNAFNLNFLPTGPAIIKVNKVSAQQILPVAAALNSIPSIISRVRGNIKDAAGQQKVDGLWYMLNVEANPRVRAMPFKKGLFREGMISGESFAYVDDTGGSNYKSWYRILNVSPYSWKRLANGDYYFTDVTLLSQERRELVLPARQVAHYIENTEDGEYGKSPLITNSNTFALAAALDKYSSDYFTNGGRPLMVLVAEEEISDEETDKALAMLQSSANSGNYHGTAVLSGGKWKLQTLAAPPNEAQFIETKQVLWRAILSLFGAPNFTINDLDKSGYRNLETLNAHYKNGALMPRLDELSSVLMPYMRVGDELDWQVDKALAGSVKEAVNILALRSQWLTIDEVRAEDNYPAMKNGEVPLKVQNVLDENVTVVESE